VTRAVRDAVRLAPALSALPRRFVSRAFGHASGLRLPGPLLRPLLALYARRYGADLGEMAAPLHSYRTFREFFTRRLAPGARPLPDDPLAVVSPADGTVVSAGAVEDGTLLQAKGAPYPLADLLGGADDARRFAGGTYLTVYLAPGDYHRFHWPLGGTLTSLTHLPGDLWPVNAAAVDGVPRLFVRNERVALLGEAEGGGAFACVPVGALNVGSIRLAALPRFRSNAGAARARREALVVQGARGEELGWFEMGSSFVLLLAPEAGRLDALAAGARLRMGHVVGRRRPA
jgi:phosphatidylserine decarboxylase